MPLHCGRRLPLTRISQGDLFRDIAIRLLSGEPTPDGDMNVQETIYNYAIVLSQECDLEQDYVNRQKAEGEVNEDVKHDKYLPTILLAPAYLGQSLREGNHLALLNLRMERYNSSRWDPITKNENKRYHFISSATEINVPELVVDFKHYFTVPRDFFYPTFFNERHYVASLNPLFREDLSSRFGHFLSRIGTPDPRKAQPDGVSSAV